MPSNIPPVNVSEPWFTLLKLGIKQVEGRLFRGDFSRLKFGDIVTFENNEMPFHRQFNVKIVGFSTYDSFELYLQCEGLDRCLPGIDSIEDGLAVYYKYYTKEEEAIDHVVALTVVVVK